MRSPCRPNYNFGNSTQNRPIFSEKQPVMYYRPNSTLPQHSLTVTYYNCHINNFICLSSTVTYESISYFYNVLLQNTSQELDCLYKTLKVEIRSGEPAVLLSYSWFTTHAAKLLGITIGSW